ncbi:MAG: sigma-54-dependent Fis family transcriptional regulator [Gammaproteobacteria bacterium]|nr:sigma-54-dependent Fis family transcriptional regulator [Gammaproteobacteria bacterium]
MARQATRPVPEAQARPAVLFVDDDPMILESLALALEGEYDVITAHSRPQALGALRRMDAPPPLALVDLGLPPRPHQPQEGYGLISDLLHVRPDMKILVLSGQSDAVNIRHALTLGAVDFIPKPCDVPLLRTRLAHQLMMLAAEQAEADEDQGEVGFIGDSSAAETLRALIRQFADTPFPVLVQGESGSGKELVAKYLHRLSRRQAEPFLTVNCAAIPNELLEAQLFGYAKGAYTGAQQARAGFFEDSGDGSLFLDEIGDMPPELQAKLLRVLENGEYHRLGETQARTSRARIIAATNRDLRAEVARGAFRADLYHRLGVLSIGVPPLRERGADVLKLLEHFRGVYCAGGAAFQLAPEAAAFIGRYRFPGNVRELRNIVIRLGAKYPGGRVSIDQLAQEVEPPADATGESAGQISEAIQAEVLRDGFNLEQRLQELERRYIVAALESAGGNLSRAARMLDINRTTLYSRLQRLGIPYSE